MPFQPFDTRPYHCGMRAWRRDWTIWSILEALARNPKAKLLIYAGNEESAAELVADIRKLFGSGGEALDITTEIPKRITGAAFDKEVMKI